MVIFHYMPIGLAVNHLTHFTNAMPFNGQVDHCYYVDHAGDPQERTACEGNNDTLLLGSSVHEPTDCKRLPFSFYTYSIGPITSSPQMCEAINNCISIGIPHQYLIIIAPLSFLMPESIFRLNVWQFHNTTVI